MKKIILAGKAVLITLFGILGMLSLMMFPFLISDRDAETSLIGYAYLGVLLLSVSLIYLLIINESKPKQTDIDQEVVKTQKLSKKNTFK